MIQAGKFCTGQQRGGGRVEWRQLGGVSGWRRGGSGLGGGWGQWRRPPPYPNTSAAGSSKINKSHIHTHAQAHTHTEHVKEQQRKSDFNT